MRNNEIVDKSNKINKSVLKKKQNRSRGIKL